VLHAAEGRAMTHRGFWIVCRNCLFPIRLPTILKTSACLSRSNRFLLSCPVCAHVERYRGAEVGAIAFRIPDPFRLDKATLYAVEVPCRVPHCEGKTWIYAVAATSLTKRYIATGTVEALGNTFSLSKSLLQGTPMLDMGSVRHSRVQQRIF
jgi:hypothetical protein